MHRKSILHRDIKSDNILVRGGDTAAIKICDLGYAVFLQGLSERLRGANHQGTKYWSAPEIHRGECYGLESDIYSFGCFAYELATGGYPPFAKDENFSRSVLSQVPIPRISPKWSDQFASLVHKCLDKDPKRRPSIE